LIKRSSSKAEKSKNKSCWKYRIRFSHLLGLL